jgi:hypothetical protein
MAMNRNNSVKQSNVRYDKAELDENDDLETFTSADFENNTSS